MADYKGKTRTTYTEKQRLAQQPIEAVEPVKEVETKPEPVKRGRPSKKG